MKIWIDITNSPHVNFFASLIRDLAAAHEIIVTSRPLANTIELLEAYGIPHHVIGRHYGSRSSAKALGFLVRCAQLAHFLRDMQIDVSISHSSFYSPVVSRLLGVRCVYLNDNEHARGNEIAFRCAQSVLVPEFLETAKVIRQGCSRGKLLKYPGVKEGVYLWNYAPPGQSGSLPLDPSRKTVFVRPEPRTAQYYKGARDFLDEVILALRGGCNVVVLPRDESQRAHYSGSKFSGVLIPKKPLGLLDVRRHCDLFIGAGGTMTREVAVLGIPTISVYQDDLLDVDRFLVEQKAMLHAPQLTPAQALVALRDGERRPPNRAFLVKGREAYTLIMRTLTKDVKNCGGAPC